MGAIKINGATSGSTTITAPDTGGDESIELSTALASKLDLAGGKILQIVRVSDTTNRSTTSTSMVDVTGMSVTITPQKSDSAIILIATGLSRTNSSTDTDNRQIFVITDSSNNTISATTGMYLGLQNFTGSGARVTTMNLNLWAYATPATTSAVTYKLRHRSSSSTSVTCELRGDIATSQMYAIEVSA